VQNAIIGDDNSVTGGLIGATTLLIVNHVVVRYLYGHDRVDRVIEGDPVVLVENGVVRTAALKHELVTEAEIEAAAHRQGFASLEDVDRAVLEAGGGISFSARKPSAETERHHELLARLDSIQAHVAALR
jgi:uncharacterized membrane protein YcaP (DUF421 family)